MTNPEDKLFLCRDTCKKLYKNEKNLPEIFDIGGGLEDVLKDPFGFKLNICSEKEGFYEKHRKLFISNMLNVEESLSYVPKITKLGFRKTRIPENLFQYFVKKLKDHDSLDQWTHMSGSSLFNDKIVVENSNEGTSKKIVEIPRAFLLNLNFEEVAEVYRVLGPVAEKWSNLKLKPSEINGIRRYLNNSVVYNHIDR